ncbi:hypothetical protein J6590_070186 [Homalodisca vitripennis]|nr:hypothetical protein J6590_070186 [Homalodisca vitripennis]
MPAPCPTYGERIAAQYSTCKFRHVRTDTRPSWPHRARTVTDMWSLNFDGHGAAYERHHKIAALGLRTDVCGNRAEPAPTLGRLTCWARCGYVCPDLYSNLHHVVRCSYRLAHSRSVAKSVRKPQTPLRRLLIESSFVYEVLKCRRVSRIPPIVKCVL